ncbi:hypothetical protein GCM10009430_40620 [Aquimarina litoralis]|uniref:Uncharacterized protein n=1 Tax=Aquimarina litoralis TaxID=584605 RepID=A0ABP3UEF1_9FLAO
MTTVMKEWMIDMKKESGETVDSLEINNMMIQRIVPSINANFDPRLSKGVQFTYKFTFRDTTIESESYNSLSLNNNRVMVINRNTGKSEAFLKKDFTLVKDPSVLLSVPIEDKEDIIEIKEFPKYRKNIFGYDCYKVIITKKSDFLKNPMSKLFFTNKKILDKYVKLFNDTIIQELYVTEKISCKYHPVIKSPEILEKYYPLEITVKDNFVQGASTTYITEELLIE